MKTPPPAEVREGEGGKIYEAPFTQQEINNLVAWQNAGWVHPLTCCGKNMVVAMRGMMCQKCQRVQDWVPAVCRNGPGENPLNIKPQSTEWKLPEPPVLSIQELRKAYIDGCRGMASQSMLLDCGLEAVQSAILATLTPPPVAGETETSP